MLAMRAIAAKDLKQLRQDQWAVIVLMLMPLAVMAFVKDTYRLALAGQGFHSLNGAEQAVPGMSTMFSFFLVSWTGAQFFREKIQGSWERWLTTPNPRWGIFAGKAAPSLVVAVTQQAVLFIGGGWLFGLRVRGSLLGVALIALALVVAMVTFSLAGLICCHNMNQLNVIANLGTIVLAGLGGALTPLAALPAWARHLAPVTPTYWAMRGYRSTILLGQGLGSAFLPVLVLGAMAAGFALIAAWRFRYSEFAFAV
jgi:ABC-2 type transport system permease protein